MKDPTPEYGENLLVATGLEDEPLSSKRKRIAQRRALWRPTILTLFGGLIVGFLVLAVMLVPVPYVIYSPGPTVNILGESGGQPVLTVEGGSNDDTGELRLVTIAERGGPGKGNVTLVDLARAALRPDWDVFEFSKVYGTEEVSAEAVQQASQAQMESSQSSAPAAALEYLGYEVPATITVAGAVPGAPGEGKVEEGDQLVSIRANEVDYPMDSPGAPFALMESLPPGTPLAITVLRGGSPVTVDLETVADKMDPDAKGSKAGMFLSVEPELPLDIEFHLEKIGGPSAGTMFALGIIDQLTEGSLTGGQLIAGTGTMSYTGKVGPVGGVPQKLHGAARDGAKWFLVPEQNCQSIEGRVPEGLEVVAIDTLERAVSAVEAIGAGETDGLPRCPVTAP